jgi:hypothetical protein
MPFHNIIRPSVGADYALSQHHLTIRRGRFIVPIADLSALGGIFHYPDEIVKKHYRAHRR